MNVVITGGAGFLGSRLTEVLITQGSLSADGSAPRELNRITLLDQVTLPAERLCDPRLVSVAVDLATVTAAELAAREPFASADVIFHLAASVSAESEADFDLGMRANLHGGQAVLEAARQAGRTPVLVFASSLAVFGQWPDQPLPSVIGDSTLPTPRSSYGIQKFITEQLVTDYTRKGFINGRSVRLMTVAVRPGRPNGAASSFLSSIIREPLAGEPAVCPVSPDLEVALSSPESAIAGLIAAATTPRSVWGSPLAVNLPAVHTTVGAMTDALAAVAGDDARKLIEWRPDDQIAAVVGGWPAHFESTRAKALGLTAEPDFETVVRRYQAQYRPGR